MKIEEKIRLLSRVEAWFPIWALKRKARLVHHAFDSDLEKARANKNRDEVESLEQQRYWETNEYEDKILALRSRRLSEEADKLYIHIPDLQWEQGNYGDRYLDRASLSKLYHAVQEEKEKIHEYRLKLAGAATGIIGALIGLIAILKK